MTYIHPPVAATRGEPDAKHPRVHAWQAMRVLVDALGEQTDPVVRDCLREAEKAAVLADTRIVELENRLEAARRQLQDLGVTAAALSTRHAEARP